MTERESIAKQATQQNGINGENSAPPKRRRRSKKKMNNIKQYFEWFMWGVVIIGFIATLIMLFSQFAGKDKEPVKKKSSIENSGYITVA